MDWCLVLLALTTVLRGLGAGMIYDVALISLPVRRHIGSLPYATYARANFDVGARTYAPVSIIGALLTLVLTVASFLRGGSAILNWSIATSLAATVMAFVGTSRALPALMSLRRTESEEPAVSTALDRFAQWHAFSALWQVVSFLALIVALAAA